MFTTAFAVARPGSVAFLWQTAPISGPAKRAMTSATTNLSSSVRPTGHASSRRVGSSADAGALLRRRAKESWLLGTLRALGRFMASRLFLRRGGSPLRASRDGSGGSARASDPGAVRRSEALRRDFKELHALLGRNIVLRRSMPQLSYVERTLARTGSRGLLEIPLQMLEGALEQLDAAVHGSATLTLDELRARLESAIKALAHRRARFENSRHVEVSEATHSLFEEIDRTWTAPAPLSDARP